MSCEACGILNPQPGIKPTPPALEGEVLGGSHSKVCLQCRRPGFSPWVGKIPWKRKWQPTPVFLPGKSYGQRSLSGYSPWVAKNQTTTEQPILLVTGPPGKSPKVHLEHTEYVFSIWIKLSSFLFSLAVTQSCPTLCNPVNRSTPGLPVHHQLPEFTQTHVHRVGDAIQSSHPLSSPSSPAPNPSQHQSLFQ